MTKQAVNISPFTMPKPAEILKQQFLKSLGWPWSDILPESRLDELLEEDNIAYRSRVYTPIVTLMVSQVLDPDKSLRNTVKRMNTWLTATGAKCSSADTGAYSKARKRLSERLWQRLVPESAEELEQQVPPQQWCGLRSIAHSIVSQPIPTI